VDWKTRAVLTMRDWNASIVGLATTLGEDEPANFIKEMETHIRNEDLPEIDLLRAPVDSEEDEEEYTAFLRSRVLIPTWVDKYGGEISA